MKNLEWVEIKPIPRMTEYIADLDRAAMECIEHRDDSKHAPFGLIRYENTSLYLGVGQCAIYAENFQIDQPKNKPHAMKIGE